VRRVAQETWVQSMGSTGRQVVAAHIQRVSEFVVHTEVLCIA
jgi:hypothetical protein